MAKVNYSAQASGISMDKLIGILTTTQEVSQQAPEAVGNAWRTVIARIQNVKAGKYSANYQDLVNSEYDENDFEALNDVETVLKSAGISLRDSALSWRNTEEVLDEIASKWETFDDITKSAISNAMAGTRRREQFILAMSNWDSIQDYSDMASSAYGTATTKMEAYIDSMAAAKNNITAAFEEVAFNIDLTGAFTKIYDLIANITRNIEELYPIGISVLLNLFKYFVQAGGGISNFAYKVFELSSMFGWGTAVVNENSSAVERNTSATNNNTNSQNNQSSQSNKIGLGVSGALSMVAVTSLSNYVYKANEGNDNQVLLTATAMTGFSTITSILSSFGTWGIAISAILSIVTGIFSLFKSSIIKEEKEKNEKAQLEFKEAEQKYTNSKEGIKFAEIIDEYADGIDRFGNNISLTEEEYQKFIDANNELAKVFPDMVDHYDSEGNAIISLGETLDESGGKVRSLANVISEEINRLRDEADQKLLTEENMQQAFDNIAEETEEYQSKIDNARSSWGSMVEYSHSKYYDFSNLIQDYKDIRRVAGGPKEKVNIDFLRFHYPELSIDYDIYDEDGDGYIRASDIMSESEYDKIKDFNLAFTNKNYKDMEKYMHKFRRVISDIGQRFNIPLLSIEDPNLENKMEDKRKIVEENTAEINRIASNELVDQRHAILRSNTDYKNLSEYQQIVADKVVASVDWNDYKDSPEGYKQAVIDKYNEFKDVLTPELENAIIKYEEASTLEEELYAHADLIDIIKNFDKDIRDSFMKAYDLTYDSLLSKMLSTPGASKSPISYNDIKDMRVEEAKSLYKYLNNGHSLETSKNLVRSDNYSSDYIGGSTKALNRYNYWSRDTEGLGKVQSYLTDVASGHLTGTIEEIEDKFSDMPKELRESLKLASEEVKEGTSDISDGMNSFLNTISELSFNEIINNSKLELEEWFSSADVGDNGIVDNFKELKNVVDELASSYERLKDARDEENAHGKISLQTALDLLAADENYIQCLEFKEGEIHLVKDAEKLYAEAQLASLKMTYLAMQAKYLQEAQEIENRYALAKGIDVIGISVDAQYSAAQSTVDYTNTLYQEEQQALATSYALQSVNAAMAGNDALASVYSTKAAAAEINAENASGHYQVEKTEVDTSWADEYFEGGQYESDDKKYYQRTGFHLSDRETEEGIKSISSEVAGGYYETTDELDGSDLGFLGTQMRNIDEYLAKGGGGIEEWYKDYKKPDGNAKDDLEKLEDLLGAINKEYQQMIEHSKEGIRGLDEYASYMDETYFNAKEKIYDKLIAKASEKIKKKDGTLYTLDEIEAKMDSVDDDTWNEMIDAYNKIQEYTVERNNLDDEYYDDLIEIRSEQGFITDDLIEQYKLRQDTKDTLLEEIQYAKDYRQAIADSIEEHKDLLGYLQEELELQLDMSMKVPGNKYVDNIYDSLEKNYKDQIQDIQKERDNYLAQEIDTMLSINPEMSRKEAEAEIKSRAEYHKYLNDELKLEKELNDLDDQRIQSQIDYNTIWGETTDQTIQLYKDLAMASDNAIELEENLKKLNEAMIQQVQDRIDILELDGVITDEVLEQYATLVSLAYTESERAKAMKVLDDKIEEMTQQSIDLLNISGEVTNELLGQLGIMIGLADTAQEVADAYKNFFDIAKQGVSDSITIAELYGDIGNLDDYNKAVALAQKAYDQGVGSTLQIEQAKQALDEAIERQIQANYDMLTINGEITDDALGYLNLLIEAADTETERLQRQKAYDDARKQQIQDNLAILEIDGEITDEVLKQYATLITLARTEKERVEAVKALDEKEEQAQQKLISMLENQGILNDNLIKELSTMVSLADTDEERLNYQNQLNTKIKEQRDMIHEVLNYQRQLADFNLEYTDVGTDRYNQQMSIKEANLKEDLARYKNDAAYYYELAYEAARQNWIDYGYSEEIASEKAKYEALQNGNYRNAVIDTQSTFKAIGDLIVNRIEDIVDELQDSISLIERGKPEEWGANWEDNIITKGGLDKIGDYYTQLLELEEEVLSNYKDGLEYSSELTDAQIKDLVNKYNDAYDKIAEYRKKKLEEEIGYQDNQYDAVVSIYKDMIEELEAEKAAMEDRYDEELDKLKDKEDAIDRTNKLIELQNKLLDAQKEKQRVKLCPKTTISVKGQRWLRPRKDIYKMYP